MRQTARRFKLTLLHANQALTTVASESRELSESGTAWVKRKRAVQPTGPAAAGPMMNPQNPSIYDCDGFRKELSVTL